MAHIEQLSERLLTHEWRELLIAKGRMQSDACAVLKFPRNGIGRELLLRNGGKMFRQNVSVSQLEGPIEHFVRDVLTPALDSPMEEV